MNTEIRELAVLALAVVVGFACGYCVCYIDTTAETEENFTFLISEQRAIFRVLTNSDANITTAATDYIGNAIVLANSGTGEKIVAVWNETRAEYELFFVDQNYDICCGQQPLGECSNQEQ